MKFLIAIFEISEVKEEINTIDLMKKTKLSKSAISYIFNEKREFLENYGDLIIVKGNSPTKYYLNNEGK